MANERAIPNGMRCEGSSTSSAALATLVRPPNDTNTRPTTAVIPDTPVVKNGSRFEPSKPREAVSARPSTMNQAIAPSTTTTRTSCSEALALDPTTFTRVNMAMSTRARTVAFTSRISTR